MSANEDGINWLGYFERILRERDKIEAERDKRLDERFRAQETALAAALAERDRGLTAALTAAKEAVAKAEAANEKRFESANEWRGQSADRERSQQEQMGAFAASLLPRETFEAFLNGYADTVRRVESFQSRIIGALAVVSILVPSAIALIVYAITSHP